MNYKKMTAEALVHLCENSKNEDSYCISPVYYLMTGRKGGWIFEDQGHLVIAVLHPNIEKSVLIYPDMHEGEQTDLLIEIEVAKMIARLYPDWNIILARVPIQLAEQYPKLICEEALMDWKYPVHILSVNDVTNLYGKRYQQIRQRINQLDVTKCKVEDIDIARDAKQIIKIASEWASSFPYGNYTNDDLLSPTKLLIDLMRGGKQSIYGHVIYYDGVAASYCIWEERGNHANAFAMAASKEIPGLSEYNIYKMCNRLKVKGVNRVNLGGSESEGLDRFKKKFAPTTSLVLTSCKIVDKS